MCAYSYHVFPAKTTAPFTLLGRVCRHFLGLVQGNKYRRHRIIRALLHAMYNVFRPLEQGNNCHRQEPASIKNLFKGDGIWDTRKIILGWIIDTVNGTIKLPPHRMVRLNSILASITPNIKVVAVKQWHIILGELRSMPIAIPDAWGLFSLLQEAFRHVESSRPRVQLTKKGHGCLDDFCWLANNVASQTTQIAELVPSNSALLSACDAAGPGMGGVAFIPTEIKIVVPILWRKPFLKSVQAKLVSSNNCTGTINNSDLELCGNIAHYDVVAQFADILKELLVLCWTIYQMYIGSEKIPQLPQALWHIYYNYKLIISGSTNIYPFMIIFRAQPMI